MTVDLTNNPDIPTTSTLFSFAASIIWLIVCLIPMFTVVYPLLLKMISTKFLPISWTSPFTVASKIEPRPSSSVFSICGSKIATALFITSALCNTKGSCISPFPNNSPTTFMPERRCSLIIASGLIPDSIASKRSASSPTFSPSIMRRSSLCVNGSAASSAAREILLDLTSTPSKSSKNLASGS